MLAAAQLNLLGSVINRALALDSQASRRVEQLSGKRLRITCLEPAIDVWITVAGQRVTLAPASNDTDSPVDCHLSGTLSAFIELLGAEDKAAAIINGDLQLRGNSQLLLDLYDSLQQTDLDWEYHLARLIGDVPAHLVGSISRDSWALLQQSRPAFARHLQEFLLEEGKLTPGRGEMEQFINGVQALSRRVERLQARIHRLQKPL